MDKSWTSACSRAPTGTELTLHERLGAGKGIPTARRVPQVRDEAGACSGVSAKPAPELVSRPRWAGRVFTRRCLAGAGGRRPPENTWPSEPSQSLRRTFLEAQVHAGGARAPGPCRSLCLPASQMQLRADPSRGASKETVQRTRHVFAVFGVRSSWSLTAKARRQNKRC